MPAIRGVPLLLRPRQSFDAGPAISGQSRIGRGAGLRVLQLLLHGDLPDPASGELYIAVTDGVHSRIVSQPVVDGYGG